MKRISGSLTAGKKKKSDLIVKICVIAGIIIAVAAAAYALYRFFAPDYYADYDDEFEDEFVDADLEDEV